MNIQKSSATVIAAILLLSPYTSWAWGRRGHQVVGENAAMVVAQLPESGFMREHSFDFGYYANVPDFAWKRPSTYAAEKPQHFMDMEIFNREFAKHPEIKNPFELSRKEFEAKFPDIKPEAGRSFWRIRELNDRLTKVSTQLRELKEMGEPRQTLQKQWLVLAGVMAHYVGDLSMPLHVSENYDGNMTGQKGIHQYFEDIVVDELYPDLGCEVHADALKQWPAFTKKNANKTVLQLLVDLAELSDKQIPVLLGIDKRVGRDDLKKSSKAYHDLIRKQMVAGTLALSELYSRQLGWKFDSNKFYFIEGEPAYVQPGE